MTSSSFSWTLTYTGGGIDRAAALRPKPEELRTLLESSEARILPVWNSRHLFDDMARPIILEAADLADPLETALEPVFLGLTGGAPWFALALNGAAPPGSISGRGEFVPLNTVISGLGQDEACLLAYARGMVLWHLNHLHCGRCGAPTTTAEGGHLRVCTAEGCGHRSFPRTDPAVITLVEHPDGDRCLLGRQSRWPEGMYSVIAGFVEPGESIEETVVREVREETGIAVTDVRYMGSQPWPFPSSLMLGFRARALTETFAPDDEELEDCRWVSRTDLDNYGEMGDDTPGPKLPNRFSIARFLVENWRQEKKG